LDRVPLRKREQHSPLIVRGEHGEKGGSGQGKLTTCEDQKTNTPEIGEKAAF